MALNATPTREISRVIRVATPQLIRSGLAPCAVLGASLLLAPALVACSSTTTAPVHERNLVVANPVSVSPGLRTNASTAQARSKPTTPARRPGALVRAPRPGDDLSRPPAQGGARSANSSQLNTVIGVAEGPATTTPPPKPKPEPETAPKPQPKPKPNPTPDAWWTVQPSQVAGRIRIVASGLGSNLREAREAAVETGLSELRSKLGSDPQDVTYEQTTVRPESGGRLRGYVLVSCDVP